MRRKLGCAGPIFVVADDFDLGDDGTLDTLVYGPGGWVGRYSDTSDYRDQDSGRLDWDRFVVEVALPDWEDEAKN